MKIMVDWYHDRIIIFSTDSLNEIKINNNNSNKMMVIIR